MTNDSYYGWSNRETWALMLHVNNDEGLQQAARDMLANNPGWNPDEAVREWAESLFTRAGYVDEYGDSWPDALADIASEIGSLWRIDWQECVKALLDEDPTDCPNCGRGLESNYHETACDPAGNREDRAPV